MSNEKDLTVQELKQRLANARATTSCLGHTKGAQNEKLMKHWAGLLAEKGVHVDLSKPLWYGNKPLDELLSDTEGVYNGEGSW